VYFDPEGESHSQDVELDLVETNYAAPAPPLWVSASFQASGYQFLRFLPGWYGDWHPVPRRQMFIFLKGESEGETSDGARLRLASRKVRSMTVAAGLGAAYRACWSSRTDRASSW
jgi:hypothetical protein